MTLHGKIQNGVVILDNGTSLPNGTPVTVLVAPREPESPAQAALPASDEGMSEEERRRILAIMDRIAALPDENPDDTFSGADHDKVLYGEP